MSYWILLTYDLSVTFMSMSITKWEWLINSEMYTVYVYKYSQDWIISK